MSGEQSDGLDRVDSIRPLRFLGDTLRLIDQRALPHRLTHLMLNQPEDVARAIRDLAVRGAPAIGLAAAYAVVLAARRVALMSPAARGAALEPVLTELNAARPTAINLAWAIARMRRVGVAQHWDADALAAEADRMFAEDLAANRQMGRLGAALLPAACGVLTHCNTGSLATAGFGTALGVIRAGVAAGRVAKVYAAETRPWLQGARLTLWELQRDGIDARLVVDGAGAYLMACGEVQALVVGADRICANGDVANKIGTLAHACAARRFGVQTIVVAPWSTVDLGTAHGAAIVIEERGEDEVLGYGGQPLAPRGARAYNPVFDVTPAELIDAIVTERGIAAAPYPDSLRLLAAAG